MSGSAIAKATYTDSAPGPVDNPRDEVLGLLDRLFGLWSIDPQSYGDQRGDRFAGQTTTHTVTVPAKHEDTEPPEASIPVSIFLPGALTDKNNVAVFFSPGDGTETAPIQPGANATNVHAMRSGADRTSWILIGVPGFRQKNKEAGWNAMTTAAIHSCLARAGRPQRIDRLRLIAHSRGGRGLVTTVHRGLVNIGIVDKVIMLDQPHDSLDKDLAAATPGRKPLPVIDYTQGPGIKGGGRTLKAEVIRAIGFARLVQDRPDPPPPPPAAALLAPILADLPRRGSFTTDASPSGGKINVHDRGTRHAADIAAITSADVIAEKEWKRLFKEPGTVLSTALTTPSPYFHVNTQNLMRFFAGPLIASGTAREFGFDLGVYAHHLFPPELSEEFFR